MNKNTSSLVISVVLALFLGVCASFAESERPNIIFLMIDDCSAVELSCYGSPDHPAGNLTPVMDRLASEGVRFETCWATPLCMPTRALFISGKYGYKTGQYGNKLSNHSLDFAKRHVTLSQRLKATGYETALAGKWHLPGSPDQPEYAWDEYSTLGGYLGGHGPNLKWDGQWFSWKEPANTFHDVGIIGKNNNTYPSLFWNGCVVENGQLLPSDENTYAPDLCQAFALDFIERKKDAPFFLYYPIVLTHDPWFGTPDREHKGKRNAPGMSAQVAQLEVYVEELTNRLVELGLWENTVLIITGDNATLAYGKGSCSEVGVRVPLIVTGGATKGRGTTTALVDFADMYPTILELAGIKVRKEMDLNGMSFKEILDGESFDGKRYIFSYLDRQRTIRNATHSMDSRGGIWKCNPSGNILDAEPLLEGEETRRVREEFLQILQTHPAPSSDGFGDRAAFDGDYTKPEHNKESLRYFELGDEWMNIDRRKRP